MALRVPRVLASLLAAALLASAPAGVEAAASRGATVRVLLAVVPSATVTAEGPHDGSTGDGHSFSSAAGLAWPVTLDGGQLLVDGDAVGARFTLTGQGAPLAFQGHRYRGSLTLRATPGGIEVVNALAVESYLRGVVPAEMSASWPMAALEAQAVAARSYALSLAGSHADYDLCASVSCQVYRGMDAENPRSDAAVRSTAGIVVTYHGAVARTYYHADSGGVTASSSEVWGTPVPYLVALPDAAPGARVDRWRVRIEPSLARAGLSRLGLSVGTVQSLRVLERSPSGRVDALEVRGSAGSVSLSHAQLTALAGLWGLKSMRFSLTGPLTLLGEGWGHGVGMSQDGARALAEEGYDYTQILGYYYPNTRLVRYLYRAAAGARP
ncbi:MAG TPA: SpoIID/LytB domain-containing protein [Trueperaceae bacterium]|nr:SpoIID/LytB domain-containing protein [Trueperaceae bacterium]